MIEQTNEIVRRINAATGKKIFSEARAIITKDGRLPGIDGKAKMSKPADNAISLSAPPEVISVAVRAMFTDPNHLRGEDPGQVEANVVLTSLDAFDEDLVARGDESSVSARRIGGRQNQTSSRRNSAGLIGLIGTTPCRVDQRPAVRARCNT